MSALDAAALSAALGRQIVVLPETTSTSDAILATIDANTPEGFVVFAEHQTAGRGQRGNRWESAAGKGLWFSILLRPKIAASESSRLTEWAARTVAETIANEFATSTTVKSPNDIYVDGKKVAGVLVEMRAQKNAPHIAILGVGLNVNQALEDFPEELRARAASLAMILGQQQDRQSLAIALLRTLERTYRDTFGEPSDKL
jgi:BirA family biotin operon repressor/biotin-[acetyl-CoA-carboxylase] ligase